MDKTTLVDLDISVGSQIVDALEKDGVLVDVALWMASPEYDDGRIVIAAKRLDQTDLLHAYEQVTLILRKTFHRLPSLLILRLKDPFIKDLRHLFAHTADVNGLRLGGQTIGNRFISEAYVYQIH